MVYGSYTTATKAGGVNAGSSSSTYDPEETGVLDLGLKGIFLDGAMLLNMNIFRNDNKGMLLAAIVDDASINYNLDAEITGFEGLMSFFPSETVQIQFSWLMIDNEITSDTSIINYLDPVGGQLVAYLGAVDPKWHRCYYWCSFSNGINLFKSGGFNCLAPQFAPAAGLPCPVAQGVAQSLQGNQLPNTAELEYSLSLQKFSQ